MEIVPRSIIDVSQDVLQHVNDAQTIYDYGFPALTTELRTEAGQFVVIGARTGCGKSMLALQIAKSMALQRLHVLYLSLEMTNQNLARRYLAPAGTMAAIKGRDATATQIAKMQAQLDAERDLPLQIAEAYGAVVDDISDFISHNRDVQVIIIDYLQLLGGKSASQYERTTDASKAIAALARETGVTIIGLAQLLIKGEYADGEPTLASIQGSSQYSQDADGVLLMWREDEKNAASRRVLKIAKNRDGVQDSNIYLDFNGNLMTFEQSETQKKLTKNTNHDPDEWNFDIES